ncbi:MAG: putative toxin-antitoxin system toxin component, PIN family [Saprospiraceae bacterium]|nr:putative toxin-antitoxin system toxin component, PIN family [Saprospiraceae bacterium]
MADKKPLKVILDTNWYISATINRVSRRRLFYLLTNKNLTILYSQELLKEYEQVISRKKFEKFIRPEQVSRFIRLVIKKLTVVEIKTVVELSRDKKDNFLLSMSSDGAADYLVTGDSDLLELKEFGKTKIITMEEFLQLVEA